jgi:hypothetical protein
MNLVDFKESRGAQVKELLAHVGAELMRPEEEISDELVFLINSRIKPPKPVTSEGIFVRTMFLISDEVNSYGGRFPLDELFNISNLVIDSPVMVGHTKEKLPIARNFKAEVVGKQGQNWLKVWFYWLKSASDALSLKENIDHGIYKECSLGFVFEFPECSICAGDMRRCQHIPFRTYQTEEGEKEAWFNYRNITRVLETSLVYRGAVPNTSMSDELWLHQKPDSKDMRPDSSSSTGSNQVKIYQITPLEFVPPTKPEKSGRTSNEIFHLEDSSSLSGSLLIEPKYDGVRAQIHKRGKEVKIFTDKGKPVEQKFPRLVKEILQVHQESFILDGELVKYKGNSRLSYKDVASYIHQEAERTCSGKNGQPDDSRFRFKAFDLLYLNGEDQTSLPLRSRKELLEGLLVDGDLVQKVKYERVPSGDLPSRIKTVASSEGAMIKEVDSTYLEGNSWYEWKRHLELDVLVTGVEKNKGGSYNYCCGVGTKANPISIGRTYSTALPAQVGDIIRVRVDYLTKTDDRFTWHAPRVLARRLDKEEPDPTCVLERMIGGERSVDGRPRSAAKDIRAADGRPALSEVEGQRTTDGFVLQLHRWGEEKRHDLRMQKGQKALGLTVFGLNLDELNRGRRFLCEWKDHHGPKWTDSEDDTPPHGGGAKGHLSKNLAARMEILDKGRYEILKRETEYAGFRIEGRILKGIYLVNKVKLKGEDRWLFWRRLTDWS